MKNRFLALILLALGLLSFSFMAGGCGSGNSAVKNSTSAESELSAKDLYRQALENSLSLKDANISGSYSVDSNTEKFKAQFTESPGKRTGSLQGSFKVNGYMMNLPMSLSFDMIGVGSMSGNSGDLYMRYTSVTTTETVYSGKVEAVFAPVLNKWVKFNDNNKPQKPTTFENQGALAALDLIEWFMPLVSLSDSDKKIFLSSVDKNTLYNMSNKIEKTTYQGAQARKIQVNIKKEALIQADKEVSASISPAAVFKPSDLTFDNEVFGNSGEISADVYLSADAPRIIGVDIHVSLSAPVRDSSYGETISDATVQAQVNYEHGLTINPPDSFITEAEMDSLLTGAKQT